MDSTEAFRTHLLSGIEVGLCDRGVVVDVLASDVSYAVLSSGTLCSRNFSERMTKEPTALAPFTTKLRMVASPE